MSGIKEFARQWKAQRTLSGVLIIVSFMLVIFAYLPTLQYDFAFGDQLRAFRLPNAFTSLEELTICMKSAFPFYINTGRPLVFISECFERSFVDRMSDFSIFRVPPFLLTLLLVWQFGRFFSNGAEKNIYPGILIGSLVALLPGYQFFLLLGTNGFMVLLSLLISAYAARILINGLFSSEIRYRTILVSQAIYLASCFIYPAFALSAIPIALLLALTKSDQHEEKGFKTVFVALLTLSITTVVYLLLTKAFVVFNVFNTAHYVVTGAYEVSFQTNIGSILSRVRLALEFIVLGELWGIKNLKPVLFMFGTLSFSILAGEKFLKKQMNLFWRFLALITFAIGGAIITLLPSAPWVFSAMPYLSERFLFASYILPISAIVLLLVRLPFNSRNLAASASISTFTLIFIVIAAVNINKLNTLTAIASIVETDYIKRNLETWLEKDEKERETVVLLVPSGPVGGKHMLNHTDSTEGPAFMGSLINTSNAFVGRWSGDPTHYFELFSGILREMNQELPLAYCHYDKDCLYKRKNVKLVKFKLVTPDEILSGSLETPSKPLVLNISSLTANPWSVSYVVRQPPVVASSSHIAPYDASQLFDAALPGWHAESNPQYPQRLSINFNEVKSFSFISFLPQSPTLTARGPKHIRVKVSDDGQSWVSVVTAEDICVANAPDGWHSVKMPNQVKTQFLEIEILENCGDPDYLTLRGLRFN